MLGSKFANGVDGVLRIEDQDVQHKNESSG
mgnify:CR=1 FL=1